MESKGWWSQEEEEAMKATQKKTVLKAFQDTEKLLKPSLKELFTDVYDIAPWNLVDIIALRVLHLTFSVI